jgi:hypothetical protein
MFIVDLFFKVAAFHVAGLSGERMGQLRKDRRYLAEARSSGKMRDMRTCMLKGTL